MTWKIYAIEGYSPVNLKSFFIVEKNSWNSFWILEDHTSNPKYLYITDSEIVLWRKDEKNPIGGSEKILKPDIYNQLKYFIYNSLPFVSCISDFKIKASLSY